MKNQSFSLAYSQFVKNLQSKLESASKSVSFSFASSCDAPSDSLSPLSVFKSFGFDLNPSFLSNHNLPFFVRSSSRKNPFIKYSFSANLFVLHYFHPLLGKQLFYFSLNDFYDSFNSISDIDFYVSFFFDNFCVFPSSLLSLMNSNPKNKNKKFLTHPRKLPFLQAFSVSRTFSNPSTSSFPIVDFPSSLSISSSIVKIAKDSSDLNYFSAFLDALPFYPDTISKIKNNKSLYNFALSFFNSSISS